MSTNQAQQILFIDAGVANAATLLASIDPSIEVVQLVAGEDGLAQIARALDGRSGIDSVHIISHGESGALVLGGVRIDEAALATHANELATIRAALSDNADMLLYGCDVSAGATGLQFTAALAAATGADIAASNDITGAAFLGGNWTLETHVGAIETEALAFADYNGTLGDPQLPGGLAGNGPWNWGGHAFQTRIDGEITDSDPENPLRAGNKWDRYILTGVPAGTTVYIYMGNSASVDDYLQVDRNGTIIAQDDDSGDGERSYDAYLSWVYQPGDVIRATTFSSGYRGTYSLFIGTATGVVAGGTDIGSAPAPVPTPTAPVFTDSYALLHTYNDSGAADTFGATTGSFTATDSTPTSTMAFSGGGAGSFGTLAVASNGAFNYTPDAAAINALAAGQTRTETFTVRVSDGALSSTKTVTINITGANDAPTLNAGVTLASVLEDTAGTSAANPGRTVANLVGGVFSDVDAGASLGGIVIVGNAATGAQGTWQYSTDGVNWFNVGAVSSASGLVLSANTRLHFVPAADYNGTPGALTVHAADNGYNSGYTSGAARTSFDTTVDAATSGVSAAASTIATSVIAVNDAPVFTSAAPTPAITETGAFDGAAFATANTTGGTLIATDIDSPVNTLVYSIRGGDVAGSSWTKVGLYGTLSLNATTHVWSYTPDKASAVNALAAGETGHDVFEFKVTDAAGASSTQTIDVSLTGTNDVPVLAHALADQSFSGAGTWKYQIPADSMTDAEGRGLNYTVDVLNVNGDVIDTISAATGNTPGAASSWLTFDEATRTFTGNPPASWNDAGLTLRVTATDGNGAQVADTFALNLSGSANQGPEVGTPLAWHAVHATSETTDFTLTDNLGGTTIVFDGHTATLGSAATGSDLATAFQSAFNVPAGSDGYTASIPGAASTLVLTADTAGNRSDFTAGHHTVAGGTYDVTIVTEGVDESSTTTDVQFAALSFVGGVSFTFAGTAIFLTGPMTAAEVTTSVQMQLAGAGANATYMAMSDSNQTDTLHMTAVVRGPVVPLTMTDLNAHGTLHLVSVSNHIDGTASTPESGDLTFSAANGATAIIFIGNPVYFADNASADDIAQAFVAALAGDPIWSASYTGAGTVSLISLVNADLNLANGSFSTPVVVPLAQSVVLTHQGSAAVAEVVEIDFSGSYGGAQITIDGITASAGSVVSAADTAAALASASYTGHTISDTGNGTIRVTSNAVGDQVDLSASDFGGTHLPATVTLAGHTDGAGWTYAIPAGTFTDPENNTLVYSAYVVDPVTGIATALTNSAALSFDAASATFSGNGVVAADTVLEVRAQDPSGASVASQFELLVTRGATPASLTTGYLPPAADFVAGAGTGHYTLPATAFAYVADGGTLQYGFTVVAGDGTPLATPAWLHFDSATATFSGNPPNGASDIRVIVSATDGNLSATTAPLDLHISAANDPLVLVSPIADQSIAAGAVFGLSVGAPFSNPDGAVDGTALLTGINYSATANGHPLSDFGLTLTVNPNGSLTFGGNPSASEPYLTIVVTGTEQNGGSSASTSFTLNLNDAVALPGSPASLAANNPGAVDISGLAIEGQTLTAALPVDADGVPAANLVHYQWQVSIDNGVNWQDVAPAADGSARGQSASLVLAETESTKQVRVQAFYNDGGGVAEAPVSSALVVQNVNTFGSVAIAGALTPGETLSATIADGDGLQLAEPNYQWYRDGLAVSGATFASYTLTNADGGHSMRVAVSYNDDHGTFESVVSGSSATVQLGALKPTAVNDVGSATEAGGVGNNVAGINPSGNVLGNDSDSNDNLRTDTPIVSLRSGNAEGLGDSAALDGNVYTVTGLYGTLTLNRVSGDWTYIVDQNNTTVDALAPGQSLHDSFNYTIGDDTNLFDTAVLDITVNGVNDAPTLVGLPTVAVFTEDVAEAIRTSFSIVDPDGGTSFGLRLTVVNGTLRDEEPTGYTRPAGMVISGTDTHVLTITANSMADVQNWLAAANLLYTSGPNQNGNLNDTLSYAVRDDNGAFRAAGVTTLEVDHANNPPVIDLGGAATTGNDYSATFRPRGGEVAVVAADVHISDIDAGDMLVSATVALTSGAYDNLFGTTYETLRSTAGSVFIGATSNQIAFSGNGTGAHGLTGATTLTLSGFGTQADYENALKTIVYNNTNPNAFSGDRSITISVSDDSGAASNTGSFASASANNAIAVGQRIFLNGVDSGFTVGEVVDNQHFVASGPLSGLVPGASLTFYAAGNLVTSAVQTGPVIATTTVQVPWTPVIDMNGDNQAGRDHVVTYTEGQSGVALATSDASITDQDGNIASVVVSLSNPLDGSAEQLFISNALVTQLAVFGVTVSGNNTGTITLGYDAVAHPGGIDATYFQIGLRAVQYVNSSDYPTLTARVVNVTSTDIDGNTGVGAHTTINLVGVNDAPNGTNGSVTALEDTALVLHATDFGFTDIDGNSLAAVKISSLPVSGSLSFDGVAVSAGQVISLADLNSGKLSYTPAADHSGPAQASFGFQVQDNGGTALGGIDLDPVANTLTINVTPVNDAPVLTAAAPHLATISEDAIGNAGQLVSSFVGSGAGQTGVFDIDTLNNGGAGSAPEAIGQGIAIYGQSNAGTVNSGFWQYSTNGGSTWLRLGTVTDSNSLLLRGSDLIRFEPDGRNGTTATISYYLWDGASGSAGTKVDTSIRGGTTAFSTGSDIAILSITQANDAPVIDLNGIAAGTDLTTIFRPRGDAVAVVGSEIVISDRDRLPGGYDDTLVSASVTLTGGALDNLFGTTYETLSSTASDSFAGSLGAIGISGNGTGAHGLTGATALTFSGAGTHADYQNALKTVLYNNSNPNAYSGDRTVQIVVHDASLSTGNAADGLDSVVATTTIQVPWTPVVDMNGDAAPGRNGVATFVERSAGVAIASADASIVDQDGNIKQVVVTLSNHPDGSAEKLSISSALITQLGSLGLTITGNNSFAITITGNRDGAVFQLALRAIQYSNSSAAPSPVDRVVTVESVDMQNNTGVGASTTIHITTINDAPLGIDSAVTLLEDTAYTVRLQDFGYSDVENHALAGVTITTLPGAGTLTLNGVAVIAGQEVSAADIAGGALVYTPVLNANNGQNPPAPTLTFQVRDAGGVANGGIDRDATPNTLTLNITPVNDLPTAADGSGVPAVRAAGMLQAGATLVALVDIADVDRSGVQISAATSYQWESRTVPNGAWSAISGATAASYTLSGADANHEVRVVVTYADDLAVPSVLSFSSDRADHPAIVADANGNITLVIDTDQPVLITDPLGDVTVQNDGTGPLTVDGMPDGGRLTYGSPAPATLSNPRGDVAIDTAGPGEVTVTGLNYDANVHTEGEGDITIANPEGSVSLDNAGPGSVTVDGLHDGETLTVGGDGPTTVTNPAGDLALGAAGPGAVTVTGLNDDATLHTVGQGDVTVAAPEGSVTLDNAGPGTVTVDSLHDGETLAVSGNGPTTVANPVGNLSLDADGPGAVHVTGLNDDATLHTAGAGDITVANPDGSVNLDNAGPGAVTVDSLHDGETLTVGGNGPTTVANPVGDLTLAASGPGAVNVTGLNDDATLHTAGAGDIAVANPEGSVTLDNAGPGAVTVDSLHDGETLTVGGNGPTTVANPVGDLTLAAGGPGAVHVTGLNDDATLHTAGAGDITVANPEGSVNLDNAGPGAVTVDSLHDGETLAVGGNGPTTVANPVGDLTLAAGGPGAVHVTGLNDDATLHTAGAGDITVANPEGSVNLDNAGPGAVTVDSLHDGETLAVGGNGPTTVANPVGDLTLAAGGPGAVHVTGLNDDATLHTAGAGDITVANPEGSVHLDNAGPGAVTVDSLHGGETLTVGGNGPTTVANPVGNLTLDADGPGAVNVTGLNDDATLHTAGAGDITVANPEGSVTLDNAGPGAVTVDSLHGGETLTVGGNGPTTVANPDGDLTVVNAGPGVATVTSLNDGATLHTAGDGNVTLADPDGNVILDNAGPGSVTVDSLNDGATLTVGGNGPTTLTHPDGDLSIDNAGPAIATVTGLNDGATLHTAGNGNVTLANPDGSVNLDNAGPGTVSVAGINAGETLHVGGNGLTTVTEPDGDLTVVNDGPGLASVAGLNDGATLTSAGSGHVTVDAPEGSVNLNNGGPGGVTVDGLHPGATLTVGGAGPTTLSNPDGDLTVVNAGPGVATVTGLNDAATLHTAGNGDIALASPEGNVNLDNAGPGMVTVNGLHAGATLHAAGDGPSTIANPDGDLTVANDGPGVVSVSALNDNATVHTSGNGPITLAAPDGSVNLDNAGPGTVTVDALHAGETVHMAGDGPTTVSNPAGDLAVLNDGSGAATITGLHDDATVTMAGTAAVTVSAPQGDLVLHNTGTGAATVDSLGNGAALTVDSATPTLVSAPLGDATLHNLGSGLMTVAGAASDSQLNFTGNGDYAVDLGGFPDNGHIELNNVDGASLQVVHAPAGATIDALGAGDTSIVAPTGDLHIHNAGTGTMLVEQPADGVTVSKTGTGPAVIDHPAGSLTLANDDSGAVTVQHLAAGSTLVLEGSGPVILDSNLAEGEHVTVDTSANSNIQLANNGKGIIDVVGDLQLHHDDAMSIHLNGANTTAMTVAGEINLDGTPLNLTLDPAYTAHLGDSITLLDNDGSDAVVGTFANLAEGAPIYLGGSLFRISYVGGTGNDVVLTRVNDIPTGVVTISGTPTQYQVLTASNTLGDTDGMGNVSYRWLADGALVAVGASYALTQAAVGKEITVVASYTDAEGTVETVTSNPTAHVQNVNDAPSGNVLIGGNATLGQTLIASNDLADIDGMGTVSYQWQANGVTIAGANGDSLTLDGTTIGKAITVAASYTDAYGAAESVTSSATVAVRDGNGVAPGVEAQAPALHSGGLVGDGNGDGILDALQPAVVSMAVPTSNGAGSSYVTLVSDSVNGKPVDGAKALTDVSSVHNAVDLPSWAQAPMDGISFTAKVNAPGATGDFSLYVDAATGVNGFWAENAHGVLVNLASAAYGGQMVTEGDKVRLDFHITEGSEFDVGVKGDSNIVTTGVAAHASLSLIGYVIDTPSTPVHGGTFD